MESKNNQLFDMENFLNIVNVFTGTFNEFYMSLLKKNKWFLIGDQHRLEKELIQLSRVILYTRNES